MPIPIPTLPENFEPGFSLSRRAPEPKAKRERVQQYHADSCKARCAGGKPCASTNKHRHQLHLCNDAECECRGELRRGGK